MYCRQWDMHQLVGIANDQADTVYARAHGVMQQLIAAA